MQERWLVRCLLSATGIIATIIWSALLAGILLEIRSKLHWSDTETIGAFAVAYGILAILLSLVMFKLFDLVKRDGFSPNKLAQTGADHSKSPHPMGMGSALLIACPGIFFLYEAIRGLVTGVVVSCGKHSPCHDVFRAQSPLQFEIFEAGDSLFAILFFLLAAGLIIAIRRRKRTAA